MRWLSGRWRVADLTLLNLTFARISQDVERISGTHDAGAGKRQGYARRINRDPSSPPLFGNSGGRARTTGWIEDEVTGIRCHQQASFDNALVRLNDIDLVWCPTKAIPPVGDALERKIVQVPFEIEGCPRANHPFRSEKSLHPAKS